MARYCTELTTLLPADEAFDYMADFANVSEWDPGIERAERTTGDGEVAVGDRFAVRASLPVGSLPLTYEVVELDAPRRIVLRSETLPVVSVDTIEVRPRPEGSIVRYDADLRLRGPLRLADPVVKLAFTPVGDRAAEGLRRTLRALGRARELV